jgi:hypothetical protein
MKIKSIYITAALLSVLLITAGCGAKDASVFKSEKNKEIAEIGEDEAVGLILGKYDFFNSFSKLDTSQKREALELRLERCLEKAAKQSRPHIKVVSASTIKKQIAHDYGFTDFSGTTSAELINTLRSSGTSWDVEKSGLRYLVAVDFVTEKGHPYVDAYNLVETGSMGSAGAYAFGPMGVVKEHTKKTTAHLNIVDVRRKLEAGEVNISSTGDQGWSAGLFMFFFLPVPYYFPWWSLTETEVCGTFGEQIVQLIAPKMHVEETISQCKSGDVVLLEFKNGNTQKVTITHIDERNIVGFYEYTLGHTTGVSYDRKEINAVKFLSGKLIGSEETTELFEMSQFTPGDKVSIAFKNGDQKQITITHIDERFVVGYVYYTLGQTTGVNYDRRDIKSIEYFK